MRLKVVLPVILVLDGFLSRGGERSTQNDALLFLELRNKLTFLLLLQLLQRLLE